MRIALLSLLFFCFAFTAQAQEAPTSAPEERPPAPPESKTPEAPGEAAGESKRIELLEKKLDVLLSKLDELAAKEDAGAAGEAADKATSDMATAAKAQDTPKSGEGAKAESNAPQSRAQRGGSRNRSGQGRREASKAVPSLALDSETLEQFQWRSIGPATMAGRITDIDIHSADPSLWWIATASGGLIKSANQGVTIEHMFDDQSTVSIGCIASDPNNKDVIWVGTGEANPRNSVSYGDGVYKSVDGGKTWKHMGLKESYQIGRILVDPKDGQTVYVGALGRLYGPNRERGVFRTKDGGETWEQVLYVDDNTGVIDMIMHPSEPSTIIAALWDRLRDGFDSWPGSVKKPEGVDGYDPIRKWGPGAGLYKTTDGGDNWKKLKNGLPSNNVGRIGLDWQTGGKNAIYAIIDCEEIGKGRKPFSVLLGAATQDIDGKATVTQVFPKSPAEKLGIQLGDVVTKMEDSDVKSTDEILDILAKKKVGEKLSLEVLRDEETLAFTTKLAPRPGSREAMPTIWLGVTGEDQKDPESTEAESASRILIKSVVKDGPAEKGGLKTDDVIVSANSLPVTSYEKFVASLQEMSAGEKLKVSVLRGEDNVDLVITLQNRPSRNQPQRSNAYMGIQGQDAPDGAKMLVVTSGGPSDKAGLKAGDVIQKVGEKKIADYATLLTEIRQRQPEDKMKLAVLRDEKTVEIEVVLGDRSGGGNSTRPNTYSYYGQRPNVQDMQGADGHEFGGIYKSVDAGETWQRVNSLNTRPMYFSVIRVDPSDDQRVYVLGVSQFSSQNGGITFESNFGRGVHADAHDLWIDPQDGRHMVIAGDGGFYASYDYGVTWDHVNTAAIGQFYHVAISPKQPYWVVGGLQDNGSWMGPAISRTGGATNEDWISISGGDGFVCRVDPNNPDLIYYESQNGSMGRRDLRTGERGSIRPRAEEGMEYRFNWETPFILSNHNSKIFYCAGNYVFRSLDRGNDLQRISPDITRTKRGSATDMAESPADSNVLYVGTDDGALWVTRNGGQEWNDITKNLRAPKPMWVASVETSRFSASRVYVTLDGHRSDDDSPYAYVSDDYGATFKPLHRDLPRGSTRCLREDLKNENLLYLGTEFGFWVSVDRGQHWTQFNQELPVVAVHDVAIHPSNGEIVLATHGRSLWACNVSVLRSLAADKLDSEIAFYPPSESIRWRSEPRRGGTSRRYVSQNPASGVQLWYSLPKKFEKATLVVKDIQGQKVAELTAKPEKGIHRSYWNLARTVNDPAQGGRSRFRGPRTVPSGDYLVELLVDKEKPITRTISVQRDPSLPADAIADEQYEEALFLEEEAAARKAEAKRLGLDTRGDD